MLTPDQLIQYQRDGYVVLPHFKTPHAIARLRERAQAIVDAYDPEHEGQMVFTTNEQTRRLNQYFLDSADKVRCFFEEEAFDSQGRLKQAKALSINKIGHAMHDLDPVFVEFSHGPELAAVAKDVGLQQAQIWQSMYIFKQPGIGGEVDWHQDATFFDTTPQSVTTFWFALEDATLHNGCLWVQPGGHHGPLRERFERFGDKVSKRRIDDTPWPSATTGAVPLEVQAGTLVVFHGFLPHYSAPNRSMQSRHAYTLHVTDGACSYNATNWLQRGADMPVSGFV
ncbi:phytanoyl-CoA dioxygenase family protein [Curvibacter sp. CHRR-16]|uniref:phytanoyl-CoA dioxygenase family protein n=1 Tax=Curvibacter sp. CHRR-16 TaxID=2835872 RepID=UPI001BDA9524|nr:phytanoyl-CoA dioxygenase family protein [Curvibacter sp. CHRR-16]MBT0569842.1 phytanoyl-CoA dioxygenase family protein [Curvibacter sp. CHRR-16]